LCFDPLFFPDWTTNPDIYQIKTSWVDQEYAKGLLAESWEMTDPFTMTVHLRKGIHWQNKPPVNGREFTASDVKYNYDRLIGLGSFDKGSPMYGGAYSNVTEVVVIDDYTVAFKMNTSSISAPLQVLNGGSFAGWQALAPPEVAEQGLNTQWETAAVGTGPYLFKEFIDGVSLTFSRNPDYWGKDERYPQNQLPYIDTIKTLVIPDMSTTLAALRTGKIDMIAFQMNYPSWQEVTSLKTTNPDIQVGWWPVQGQTLDFRCDLEPFTDIRVRKALQMAIDLKTIAETYYGGTIDGTPCGLVNPIDAAWRVPFEEWPAELQEEYSYNPERARELLTEAGYPDGFQTTGITSLRHDQELIQIMQAQLHDIGVDIQFEVMDHPIMVSMAREGKEEGFISQITCGIAFGPLMALNGRVSPTMNISNMSKNSDPIYDAMVEKVYQASSITEAQELCKEADMYVLGQHWGVTTFVQRANILWQKHVKGYSSEFLALGCPFYSRIWIDK
jgi:ABC-type transport system substrate-binding protein